jgi:hypothetical protein
MNTPRTPPPCSAPAHYIITHYIISFCNINTPRTPPPCSAPAHYIISYLIISYCNINTPRTPPPCSAPAHKTQQGFCATKRNGRGECSPCSSHSLIALTHQRFGSHTRQAYTRRDAGETRVEQRASPALRTRAGSPYPRPRHGETCCSTLAKHSYHCDAGVKNAF